MAEFFLAQGKSDFVLFSPSTDLVRPTHTESALLRVQQFKCYSHPKRTIKETSRVMFDQISRHHDPATLTHKINHGDSQTVFYRTLALGSNRISLPVICFYYWMEHNECYYVLNTSYMSGDGHSVSHLIVRTLWNWHHYQNSWYDKPLWENNILI